MSDSAPKSPAPAPKTGGPIPLSVGQVAIVTLSFVDGMEDALGPMPAPAAGSVSVDPPNVVNAAVALSGAPAEPQVTLRLEAVNPGKTTVNYRCEDVSLAIPVEVVRRVAKSVAVNYDSVTRSPL